MTVGSADPAVLPWGTCSVCEWTGHFIQNAGPVRETFTCGDCRASLRYRAQADAILWVFDYRYGSIVQLAMSDEWKSLQVFEPGIIGPFRRFFKERNNYLNSFYWPDVMPGECRNGVVCQNLMNLRIPERSFDIVITSDIFEHIREPMLAFREIKRVLKVGGRHIFTVPTADPVAEETVRRVDTATGEDVYLLPEVYHGSGDGGRSLVYTDFGMDILDPLADIGLPTRICWYGAEDSGRPRLPTFVSTRIA